MPYEDPALSFKDFVENNPLECSKKASEVASLNLEMQYAFLSAIERAVNAKKKVDWNAIIVLIESYVDSALPHPTRSFTFDLILESCRIIEKGLKEYQIDYALKNRVLYLVQKFINLSNGCETDTKYLDDDKDSLFISINSLGGVSFHALFRYIWWCHHNEETKDVFTDDVKKILEDYINEKMGEHTIARHSAVGLHLNTMFYFDPGWTDNMLVKIASSKSNKIAFWESYVPFNQAREETLLCLHTWYREFLNGKISDGMHKREFYRSTIEHATLGYLYGIEHFDKIFEGFISSTEKESIYHCGFIMFNILDGSPDVPKIKDKVIKLWKTRKFIDYARLDMWFAAEPFDKKENIGLFLNYMQNYHGELSFLNFPLDELEGYVDGFPYEVAQCIQIFVEKVEQGDLSNIPDMLKLVLERLCSKKISSVNVVCKKTIGSLVTLGYNDYKDIPCN